MYLVPRLRTSEDFFSGLDAQLDADLLGYGSGLAAARQSFRSTTAFVPDGVGVRNSIIPPALLITTNNVPDNYQPVESAWNIPGPTALIDVYTPDENTTGTLVVDGAHVIAASDTPGDNDWFAVTLTAGVTYEFGQYAYAGHVPGAEGNGVPLADAYLEIYDSDGNLLSYADGGGPNTPSGLDALMTFEAPTSGTYYVNATSYDNDGDGIGDFAGDYELFARTATGTVYTTPYDINSPLHSIDWGGVRVNREHESVPNPDGMEGPRPTGGPPADPADVEGNAFGFPGKNVIFLYFAGEGDLYAHQDSTIPAQVVIQNPYQYEVQAMLTAANEFSKVADVVFVSNYTLNPTTGLYERDDTIQYKPGPMGPETGINYAAGVDDGFDADFFYFSYPGTPGPVISLLGSMNPPDYGDEGVAQFNSADERWNAQMLQPGGFSFVTLIHEFGHGMGLAHPHDTGGGSSVMQGVQTNGVPGDDGGAGAFDLNQGVHTMMSYNDGWEKSPYGQAETNNEGYGWLGSLMAFDIAVIQDKYGVNEDWATGNDSYVLKDVNEWGVYIDAATGQPAVHDATNAGASRDGYYVGKSTYYSSIWDAGGVDQITYSGARNTTIDLRAATLQYEVGGGGRVSFATGIYGGFTIANGVTIENATSGSGNDTLNGNAVANLLDGGAGNDTMVGGAGDDTYAVDSFSDVVTEASGEGTDTVRTALGSSTDYNALYSLAANVENLVLTGSGQGVFGNALDNTITATGGNDLIVLSGSAAPFTAPAQGNDTVNAGGGNDFIFFGGSFNALDTVDGGAGSDTVGLLGNYAITLGATTLTGIERFAVYSSGDLATPYNYALTTHDGNVAAGKQLFIGASTLQLGEHLTFNGSAETNGTFHIVAGHDSDTLVAGAGNDRLFGGGGADLLTGGAGSDVFQYNAVGESTAAARDQILDFAAGDKLDLWFVDANANAGGNQAFAFIGAAAFGNVAGQLRATQQSPGQWLVEGDVDGDGLADLSIAVTVSGGHVLGAGDFVL